MQAVLFALDVVAVLVLVFGIYLPRHRRRDLVLAFLGVNCGVLAVTTSLSSVSSSAGFGLGLGLLGVLSIIRLRSTELDHHEVAYYFAALALGVIGALGAAQPWVPASLMALLLLVLYIGDHPRWGAGYRRQVVILDQAVAAPETLQATLEQLLGGTVHRASVQRLDLVNDTTVVDVLYSAAPAGLPSLTRDVNLREGARR
ncbi:MAG: DUF4956 domain-containing protein [Kineosporiaceae bacterium]